MGNIKNVVRGAIEHNELKECMMGMGKYRYSEKNYPGPFNERLVLQDFYSMYVDNPMLKMDKILDNILREMLDGDIKEIFSSISYIYTQKKYEKKQIAGFNLDDSILNKINQVVHDRKAELEAADGIEEFFVHQNVMKVLRNINNLSIKKLGFALFQE